MLSINRIKHVYPRCKPSSVLSFSHGFSHISHPRASRCPRHPPFTASKTNCMSGRHFSGSRVLQDGTNAEPQSERDIEKVVRETKQRFRDTLPTGYLNEQEYALYVRLYGPPLRETSPEDVGIPTHADMGTPPPQAENQGTALRELEDGGFEEIIFGTTPQQPSEGSEEEAAALAGSENEGLTIVEKAPGYIDVIARNPREHSALQKLMQDFEVAQQRQRELELAAAEAEEMQEQTPGFSDKEEVEEFDDEDFDEDNDDEADHRFHPYTLAGKFAINPVQLVLPKNELIQPIDRLLDRTHLDHVKAAAEAAFGGQSLPLSPATSPKKAGGMVGVGLPPDQKFMTEIEADAFLATYIPPAYASVASILRETRKRLGNDWIQSRLSQGSGLSVLDAGAGGAGLVAWEEILQAEWGLLKEQGAVEGKQCPGRKTVIVGSDRLRHRLKTFLHDTTFLPRLPDYEHSGDTQGEHLEAGRSPQPRKSYDVIIASHLFLKEDVEHKRQAVLNNLWSLLNKDGGVLVVIEKAHPRGFEAMAHVRDTVLKHFLLPQADSVETTATATEALNPAFHREREPGHVVAPCTTQGVCPLYRQAGKSQGRKDICHFHQRYFRPKFHSAMYGRTGKNQGTTDFSYVVIQRGRARHPAMTGKQATATAFRGYQNANAAPDMQSLPRVVLPPLKRKGHVTMDVCTAEGLFERWTVPKSFSKLAYHDARKSRWGDLWALGAKTRIPRKVRLGGGVKPDEKAMRSEKKKARRAELTAEERREKRVEKKARTRDKRLGLIEEILEAEALEEEEMEREMDEELGMGEGGGRRRRRTRR